MSEHPNRYYILAAIGDAQRRATLEEQLRFIWHDPLQIVCEETEEALQNRLAAMTPRDDHVGLPIVVMDLHGRSGVDLLKDLHRRPDLQPAGKLLISHDAALEDVEKALNADALDGNIPADWTPSQLADLTRTRLTRYFIQHAPQAIDPLSDQLDVTLLSRAFVTAEHHLHAMGRELKRVQRSFMTLRSMNDREVEDAMIAEVDKTLNNPPRETLSAGTLLLKENEPVDNIWILIEGKVSLYRVVNGREIIFHSATVGRIVGLLALALGETATFSCRAETSVTVMRLSHEQVDRALQQSPSLSIHFVTVILRSLARRSRRSIQQQVEINQLNVTLARERDQLQQAYQQLRSAQTRLVESEKMATLGQLAAGIGHELNNPVAAIKRNADFLSQDLLGIARDHPDADAFAGRLEAALERPPISTREQRARRKRLTEIVGDRSLAKRLVKIGLDDPGAADEFLRRVPAARREARLRSMERYYMLGTALKNILACADSITSLVTSIRSYARSEREINRDVDIHEGIEQTILLFGPNLRNIDVLKEYGDLPRIEMRTGEINQVWTNLISNAIQVMPEGGKLRVVTDQPDDNHVRVRIIDNGPGIPEDNIERIFDVNFTTRHGLTGFGLGIGLPICREIVDRHGGSISVESRPGRTCFTVTLPLTPADTPSTADSESNQPHGDAS